MTACARGMRPFSSVAAMARRLMVWLGALLALGLAPPAAEAAPGPYADPATALRDYVAAEDDAYGYALVDSAFEGDGYAIHLLRMTSQRWRPTGGVRPVLWEHWLVVIVPDEVDKDIAALVIAGGSRGREPPSFDREEIRRGAQLAVLSGTVVAVVMVVPHQPLSFPDEPFPHREDALVAYSWDKAIETGDYSWPVYLPMVKAAVRAMDTVQDFVPSVAPAAIERFVVVGASKRGAATWLTAAVDARVAAIAPLVIDILNFPAQVEHHLAVYGTYAPAIADYVAYGLVQRVDTPEGRALTRVVDPYSYLGALDMPKYILNSTGDQFFPPDSSQFYFDDLPGESLLRYVPNSSHSLGDTEAALIDAVTGLFGWYLTVVEDRPRPALSWEHEDDGLVVRTSPAPLAARLWRATNPKARDFRLGTTGAEAWRVTTLVPAGPGEYAVSVPPPPAGWTAYFVELVYPSPRPGLCQVYSTNVFVTPDVRPFEGTGLETAAGAGARSEGDVGPPPVRAASPFEAIVRSAADQVHGAALEQAFPGGGDLAERALRYCLPQRLDELDDVLDLYVRLGSGRSAEGYLEDQLESLWGGLRREGGRVIDGVRSRVDDLF